MEKSTIRRVKMFFLWQDEKEEEWLRTMARDGCHLTTVAPLIYTFAQGESRDDVYRLDYLSSNDDYEEYRQLFRDAGWEYVGEMIGWQYFRKPACAEGPHELYTDAESKVERYGRVLTYMIIFMPILLSWVAIDYPLCIKAFMATMMALWAYSVLRLMGRIRQLRRL